MKIFLLFMILSAEADIQKDYNILYIKTRSCYLNYYKLPQDTSINKIIAANYLRDCLNWDKTESTMSSRNEIRIVEAEYKIFRIERCSQIISPEWDFRMQEKHDATRAYIGYRLCKQYKKCINKAWENWDSMRGDWRKFSNKFKKKFLDK